MYVACVVITRVSQGGLAAARPSQDSAVKVSPHSSSSPSNASCEGDAVSKRKGADDVPGHGTLDEVETQFAAPVEPPCTRGTQ